MKKIRLTLWSFLILITILFLLAVIIWVIITPIKPAEETQIEPEKGGESAEDVVGEVQEPVRAIGEIESPKLIKKVEPVYPENAREAGVEGVVILEVITDIY